MIGQKEKREKKMITQTTFINNFLGPRKQEFYIFFSKLNSHCVLFFY